MKRLPRPKKRRRHSLRDVVEWLLILPLVALILYVLLAWASPANMHLG
jgi:hypothetical protein